MPKQTTFNDAQVRSASVTIEQLAKNILSQAVMLREQFDALYPNLKFADPVKHADFDRYMLAIARAKSLCEVCPGLAWQAREMQRYGLPNPVSDVSTLNRLTISPAVSCSRGGDAVAVPA